MSTSNSDSNEFTASECSDSEDLYSNKSTECSESNQSSSDEENEENEVYPPEEDPSNINCVVRNPDPVIWNIPSPESSPS